MYIVQYIIFICSNSNSVIVCFTIEHTIKLKYSKMKPNAHCRSLLAPTRAGDTVHVLCDHNGCVGWRYRVLFV